MNIHNLKKHLIDLSHPVSMKMPHWPGDPLTVIQSCSNVSCDGYNLNQLTIGEHSGTHLGAPFHFLDQGKTIDQIKLQQLVSTGIKVDISAQTGENADYLATIEDVLRCENDLNCIPQNAVVLFESGWSRYWHQEQQYWGSDEKGMHFPGITLAAADYLVNHWKIAGLGIDTAGIDGGQSKDLKVNRFCAQHDVFHLENLTRLHELSLTFTLFIGALAIERGSGSPCRVLAMQEKVWNEN
ncbi:MAG: cyclase family protein [Calditrichaeota bacterium]|nr:MAG: cyclase family protein [Calditrichota bacterium]